MLTRFHDRTIILPPRYYGNITYYATMAAYSNAVIDTAARFNKRQKTVHRCEIADVNGPLSLTVPINHNSNHSEWDKIGISDHGQWWHIHRVSLESAYGRTPFFEFYIDRFLPFLSQEATNRYQSITDLDIAIDREIRRILLIETTIETTSDASCQPQSTNGINDTLTTTPLQLRHQPSYYQPRASKLGFIPNLSILDLIFNLGPESPLYIRSLIDNAI